MARRVKNLTGLRFTRWTVVELSELRPDHRGKGVAFWRCRCDCGREGVVRNSALRMGRSRSCGCLQRDTQRGRVLHGATGSPTYVIWAAMRARCLNPNNKHYADYGGRGISVCDRWADYRSFLADLGERPPGYSIERRDVNGNYCPENCLWIPLADQRLNQRNIIWVEHDGARLPLKHFAAVVGVSYYALANRVKRGATPQAAAAALLAA